MWRKLCSDTLYNFIAMPVMTSVGDILLCSQFYYTISIIVKYVSQCNILV